METIQIDFLADDEESRSKLASSCEGSVATDPMYFSGEDAIISILVYISAHSIPAIMATIREHIKSKRYIKVKIQGGPEISGASLREIDEFLRSRVEK